jgi:Deacetylase PdaC/Protein of unknown function (DUF3298)
MSHIKSLVFLFCLSLFVACKNNPSAPQSDAPLTFKVTCQDSTAGNVHEQVCYPVFEGEYAANMQHAVTAVIEGDSLANLHKKPVFGGLFAQYAEDIKGSEQDEFMKEMTYESSDSVSVTYNTSKILCLSSLSYHYSGGAHGSAAITYKIVNPSTGAFYKLADFFKPNTQAELLKIGEECFRKQVLPELDMKPDAALTEESGLWFGGMAGEDNDPNKGKFYLATEVGISEKGFDFVYGQYEIGAYAIGMPSFTIPFDKIKHLLKAEYQF